MVNWPMGRLLLSYCANIYARWLTGLRIWDLTGGFKCFRRHVLEAIDLDQVRSNGYAFQIEMKFAAWKLHFKLKEVPIIFQDRTQGQSKMNKGIVKEGILGVLKLRWHSLFTNYRKRVYQSALDSLVLQYRHGPASYREVRSHR